MKKQHAAIAILIAAALLSPASADQIVYFVNGKAITVKSVEKGPKITVLEVEGGGRIGVPSEQIEKIEDLQPASPGVGYTPPVAAPPVTAPAAIINNPPVGATNPATTPTPPTASPVATGPGTGGHMGAPGSMPTQPIGIGGDTVAAGTEAATGAKEVAANPALRSAPAGMPPPMPGVARQDGAGGRTGAMPQRQFRRGNAYSKARPPILYGGGQQTGRPLQPGGAPAGAAAAADAGLKNPPPPPEPEVPVQDEPLDEAPEDPAAASPAEPGADAPQGEGAAPETPTDDGGNES